MVEGEGGRACGLEETLTLTLALALTLTLTCGLEEKGPSWWWRCRSFMPATSSSTIFWVSVIRCLRSLSCSPIGGSLFSRASSAFLRASASRLELIPPGEPSPPPPRRRLGEPGRLGESRFGESRPPVGESPTLTRPPPVVVLVRVRLGLDPNPNPNPNPNQGEVRVRP